MPDLLELTASESEIHGPLKYIVRSAHKWGGNGAVPDFNKIRRVLTEKHPEVIAKAFGGDPDKAAAWIKDGWEKYYGRALKGKGGVGPTYWRGKGKGGSTDDDATMSLNPFDEDESELFMADVEEDVELESENELWAPVCRTGTWQRSPLPGGKPLEITRGRLENWVRNFRDGAWENVTLPLTHKDQTHENTGFVKDLDIRPDPNRAGQFKLWAKHHFTEPDILGKVRRGTIRGRSVGVAVNGLTRTSDGRRFDEVLKHVCLTNHPWLDGLDDAPLAASWRPEDEFWADADGDDDGDTGSKHAFRGPKGEKCKVCGKSYGKGNHYGSEDMNAAEDELEMDALDHAVALLLGTPRDPDAEEDASGEPDADDDDQSAAPQVIGALLAPKTLGDAKAGEYVIPHARIERQNRGPDDTGSLKAARDGDGPDKEGSGDQDLPDMPPGVHHVEGDHPTMKKHKLLTEVSSGKQRAMPHNTMVTPFVPYMSQDGGSIADGFVASQDRGRVIRLRVTDPSASRELQLAMRRRGMAR